MRFEYVFGFALLLGTGASSADAPKVEPLREPLRLELELEREPDATGTGGNASEKTLFAVVPELGLRVPLERVREPFRCTTARAEQDGMQAVSISCDPTQRTTSRVMVIANSRPALGPAQPDLLKVDPRRCSENCVTRLLDKHRTLELALPLRGEVLDAPCPDGVKPLPLDVRFETRFRVDTNDEGVLARLPFWVLSLPTRHVAVEIARWRSTCVFETKPSELTARCGDETLTATLTQNRLTFGPGARGALVLPCGTLPRWPRKNSPAPVLSRQ